jgi:cytochrome c553
MRLPSGLKAALTVGGGRRRRAAHPEAVTVKRGTPRNSPRRTCSSSPGPSNGTGTGSCGTCHRRATTAAPEGSKPKGPRRPRRPPSRSLPARRAAANAALKAVAASSRDPVVSPSRPAGVAGVGLRQTVGNGEPVAVGFQRTACARRSLMASPSRYRQVALPPGVAGVGLRQTLHDGGSSISGLATNASAMC